MNYDQPDLFTLQAETVDQLPRPAMSYADATLNFKKYQEEVRHGLCSFEDNEPQFSTVTECSLPTSSGITQIVERYGSKREINFTIYGRSEHLNASEVINSWLKERNYNQSQGTNSETEAGKWILAHAAEMNSAQRYYDAVHKNAYIENLERQAAILQEDLRIGRLDLSVKVREAAEDRNFSVAEKQLLLKELGALDKDLTP